MRLFQKYLFLSIVFKLYTIKCYNEILNKPKLTDKMLRKPAFRLILDIVKGCRNNTGYAIDIYDDYELEYE
mgnify:CR=1 FL=1